MELHETTVDDIYGEIKGPWWDDKPVAIVAGGPSLRGFDWEVLRDYHVLAVKGSIFDIPWADAGFGLDMPRFEEWRERLSAVQMPIYWAVPVEHSILTSRPSSNMTFIKRMSGDGVSSDPSAIYSSGTSGHGALQVALLKHGRKIALFGFDYNPTISGIHAHNRRNDTFRHNDRHYGKRRAQNYASWKQWAKNFDMFKGVCERRGIEVVNACENSAITTFRRTTHAGALEQLRKWHNDWPKYAA